MPSTPSRVQFGHGVVFGLHVFTAHQSGPWITGRTPEVPLAQDSLTGRPRVAGPPLLPPMHQIWKGVCPRRGNRRPPPALSSIPKGRKGRGAPRAASSPPSTYIYVRRDRGNTHHDSQAMCGAPLPLVRPRSYFCSARRSPTEIVASPPSPRRRAAGTHLLLRLSCWIKKARTSSS